MSDKTQIAARASLIEQLMSERNFEHLGDHLTGLEALHMTKEHLQQTDVVRAVYRVLKNCPTVALKKKAKCLLSKWKALYKDPPFTPRDPRFFPVGGNNKNSGLSCDSSQDETLGGSRSDSLPLSQDVRAKATEMIVPENSPGRMEPKEEHVRGDGPKSTDKRASELLDPVVAVRTKCTELLYEALTSSSTDQPKAELWQNFAREIEEHVFTLYSKNLKKYKTCIRSKVANLKNPQNSHLQQSLLSGTTSPREFAEMTTMEMASKELKQLRAAYTESGIQEHRLPQGAEGTQTQKIKCRRCEKFNCKVTVIARGTLFLPSWVRKSNPDEDMMTYVICNECGEQWYHSNWVCLEDRQSRNVRGGDKRQLKVPTSGPAPIPRPHPVLPGPRPWPSPCCSLGAGREPRESDCGSAFAAASSLHVSDGVAFLIALGQARPELGDILRVAGRLTQRERRVPTPTHPGREAHTPRGDALARQPFPRPRGTRTHTPQPTQTKSDPKRFVRRKQRRSHEWTVATRPVLNSLLGEPLRTVATPRAHLPPTLHYSRGLTKLPALL